MYTSVYIKVYYIKSKFILKVFFSELETKKAISKSTKLPEDTKVNRTQFWFHVCL